MKKISAFILTVLFCSAAHANRGSPRFDTVTQIGDVLQLALPISALAYSAFISDWQGVKQLGMSFGSTLVMTQGLKYTVREERPYQDEGADGITFPSGHTSSAFSGAAYWQMRYGWWVGVPAYAMAAFVGYSRNHARMHSWFDIVTAAGIGIGFNLLFTSRYIPKNANIAVAPTDGGAMLRFNAGF